MNVNIHKSCAYICTLRSWHSDRVTGSISSIVPLADTARLLQTCMSEMMSYVLKTYFISLTSEKQMYP